MVWVESLVSVVVLNWNGDVHVHRCLEHVFSQRYKLLEVLCIDNGSIDGSLLKIKQRYGDRIVYVENDRNLGFAAAMNQGIRASRGEFVVPLNQDVCLGFSYAEACVQRMRQDPEIGAIGGRVFAWVGDRLTTELRKGEGELTYFRKRFQLVGGIPSQEQAFVFSPSGSFPFLRRSALDDIYRATGDFYDEMFETGWEDSDLFFRMHLRGWKCLFLPQAFGWHVGSGSVGGRSTFFSKNPEYRARILRNRYFTIIKNLPFDIFVWLLPHLLLTEIAMLPYLLIRSPRSVLSWITAVSQVLRSLTILREKRRLVQSSAKMNLGDLKRLFWRRP